MLPVALQDAGLAWEGPAEADASGTLLAEGEACAQPPTVSTSATPASALTNR